MHLFFLLLISRNPVTTESNSSDNSIEDAVQVSESDNETIQVNFKDDEPEILKIQVGQEYILHFENQVNPYQSEFPHFSSIDTDKVRINLLPSSDDIGKYQMKVKFLDYDNARTFEISVVLSEAEIDQIETEIVRILGDQAENYGIYIYDLKRNISIAHNSDDEYPPASISKVPVAIIVLKNIQEGKLALKSAYPLTDEVKQSEFDALTYFDAGTYFTIEELLQRMIEESYNTGLNMLENISGGIGELNIRHREELGINNFFRIPFVSTPREIGLVFQKIYNGVYLDEEWNKYLLDLMTYDITRFNDRIAAVQVDFPESIVAHKTGYQYSDETGLSYVDAGIVFGEKTDFVIVILNTWTTEHISREKSSEIVNYVYSILN